MAVTLTFGSPGYDIFVSFGQSNNFSSYHRDLAVDIGHARIFQMENNATDATLAGPITQVTGEPLSYPGAVNPAQPDGPPIGNILAFCRDYYLPNRLQATRNILIVPCGIGGVGFSNYFNAGTPPPGWGIVGGVGGLYHERCITRVNAAVAAMPGSIIKGCFCHMGEADASWIAPKFPNGTTTSYYSNLEGTTPTMGVYESFRDYMVAAVADFRARWTGGSGVPFLFGQMSQGYVGFYGYKGGAMKAIEDMATHVPNSISISSVGLTTVNTSVVPPNDDWYGTTYNFIHFDAESQRGSVTQTNPFSKRHWVGYQTLVP